MVLGVKVSVTFHIMFVLVRFGLLSGHLLRKAHLVGSVFSLLFCLLVIKVVILVISRFVFESGVWFLKPHKTRGKPPDMSIVVNLDVTQPQSKQANKQTNSRAR